jgi:hypothetical protein
MLFSKKTVTLMFIAAVVGLIVYASFQPTLRLKQEIPKAFMDDISSWPPQKRAQEEKIARAYWQCALNTVQWNYGYGHHLPDDPPPEFLVTAKEVGTAVNDTGSRMRYWHNLGRVWYQPNSWEKTYGFDLNSVSASLQAAGTRLELFLRRITGSSW